MAQFARVAADGIPHHVIQRGNAGQIVFNDAQDRLVYLRFLRTYAEEYRLGIWAWCLMSNHVQLLAVPETSLSLTETLHRTRSQYERYRNARIAIGSHIWQAPYYICPIDPPGAPQLIAYIERTPVRAGLADFAEDYPWSSAWAHISGQHHDGWLETTRWREDYSPARWREVLRVGIDEKALEAGSLVEEKECAVAY